MVIICGDVFRVKGNREDCEDFRPSKKNTGGRRPPAVGVFAVAGAATRPACKREIPDTRRRCPE
jgi:hypothetical protein